MEFDLGTLSFSVLVMLTNTFHDVPRNCRLVMQLRYPFSESEDSLFLHHLIPKSCIWLWRVSGRLLSVIV